MAIIAAQLVARVAVEGSDAAKRELDSVGGKVNETSGILSSLAGGPAAAVATAATMVATALIGVGVQSVKMAGNFQQSMTTLVTGAGESQSNLKMVSDGILKLAVDTGTTTKQLTDGMYMIESAGYHGKQGLDVLKAAAEGAKVGNASLATVANGVTTAMTDYAKQNLTASQATNTLIATVSAGKTNMQALSTAMSTILPTSAAVGVSFTDTSAAMATMTGEGTSAASAATYLRQLLMALEAPASKGAKALQEIGLSTKEVSDEMKVSLPDTLKMITDHLKSKFPEGSAAYINALKDISGGSKQMQGMLELTGDHLKVFQGNVTGITDAVKKGGDSITGWSLVQQNFNFRIAQAKEVVETLGIKLGTALLPVVTATIGLFVQIATSMAPLVNQAFQGIGKAIDWVGSVLKTVDLKGFNEAWKAISVEIGSVEYTFGKLANNLKPTNEALAPIATTIRSIAQSGINTVTDMMWRMSEAIENIDKSMQSGGLKSFAPHIDPNGIMTSVKEVGQIFLNLSPAVNIFDALSRHAQDLGKWFQSSVVPALKQAQPGFESLQKAMAGLLPAVEKISEIFHNTFQKAFDALLPVFEKAVPLFIRISGLIADGLGKAIQFAMPYIVQIAGAIGQFAGDIAQRIAPIISQWLDQMNKDLNDFLTVWNAVWPYLAPILKGLWDEIVGVVKIAWALVSGIIKIGLDILSGNWKQAWKDFKDMLAGVWDGIKTFLSGAWEIIKGIFSAAWAGIKAIWAPVGGWFNDRWKDIQNVFGGIGKWFSDRWNEIYTPLKPVVDFIGSIFQTIYNIIVAIIGIAVKWLEERWKLIVETVKVYWAMVQEYIEYYLNLLSQKVHQFIDPIVTWLQDKWNTIKNDVNNAWQWISNNVSQWWGTISKTISDKANDLKNAILQPFNSARDAIGGVIKAFGNNMIDQINGAIKELNNFLNGFADALNNVAKALGAQGTVQHVNIQTIPHYATGTPTGGHPADGLAIVGEKGREAVWLPRGSHVIPNNRTEQLMRGGLPGYADGTPGIDQIWNWISGGAKGILDNMLSAFHIQTPQLPGMLNDFAGSMFGKVKDWALGWIDSILPKFDFSGGGGNQGGGSFGGSFPGNLQAWIAQAMALTHVPANWAGALATIAMNESGGDPNAQNNWDSNAAAGDPSRGLFQTIMATFRAYALPGHGDIFSPVDNAAAAIEYIISRYGSVFNVPGIVSLSHGGGYIGYANGTSSATEGWHWVGERGPELAYLPGGTRVVPNSQVGGALNNIQPQIIVQPAPVYLDGRLLTNGLLPYIADAIRYNSVTHF